MKKPQEEKVEMMCVENKRGAVLLRNQYETLAGFILHVLKESPDHEIGLNQLLELAHPKLDAQFHGDVSWFLLQVKQDLEARKQDLEARSLITTTLTRNREQFVSLKHTHIETVHTRIKRYPAFS